MLSWCGRVCTSDNFLNVLPRACTVRGRWLMRSSWDMPTAASDTCSIGWGGAKLLSSLCCDSWYNFAKWWVVHTIRGCEFAKLCLCVIRGACLKLHSATFSLRAGDVFSPEPKRVKLTRHVYGSVGVIASGVSSLVWVFKLPATAPRLFKSSSICLVSEITRTRMPSAVPWKQTEERWRRKNFTTRSCETCREMCSERCGQRCLEFYFLVPWQCGGPWHQEYITKSVQHLCRGLTRQNLHHVISGFEMKR